MPVRILKGLLHFHLFPRNPHPDGKPSVEDSWTGPTLSLCEAGSGVQESTVRTQRVKEKTPIVCKH